MIVLALDSGIERTGYALFNKEGNGNTKFIYLTSGLIQTSKTLTTEKRLEEIYSKLEELVKKHKPDLMVMEQLLFFKNQKTAIRVSQAQGATLLLAAHHNIPAEFLAPLQIKQIVTGYGQSDKKAVQKMLKLTLNLDLELKQDDQADAIACGLAYCYLNKNLV
ncbi:crossover junction endodeoxyribonuclease RuvC [Candidatus Roizmanbacteria bacterium RIFCSPLOWO2_12_FULL_40_12]|uniref:Crossover junction endodeoxyribonuclease RuvC n=1 Tax=Candidatus Roizmanbacteria bacterium RIFCSPLOWO2_01_FULL_40_42 TaxID=1802066 RepID=A0A1F7J5S5_9BACT|nr:MAG: crossover junction endodeoxyribonuclease RuvC [Candidatus Roizmanbacteria bacterium RIFCSPHIGHO2_01_FULL_40_98]OGK28397.1 MAG: crossover junction endodeoxyribonuclease RuvC [Candidatus Roizmanbacteria bacterium RIFCSPHIGHO2_02_FULL_40_53]OGK30633.1 MAG: crossover junction endodeoxyribonuclease RuvC [Candidatus Roizmanbacteria bacterium RIFCSPHIGHO2_12_41_18]OGK50953.1 MAG: crossover junction endodeoxyribonuclease RuvC [Candidatus Roizmanbacteria bacterium RIFCSPLOWO2_01_FULL_40_42]OGK60